MFEWWFLFVFIFLRMHFSLCIWGILCHTHGYQRPACGSWLPSSTTWALGIQSGEYLDLVPGEFLTIFHLTEPLSVLIIRNLIRLQNPLIIYGVTTSELLKYIYSWWCVFVRKQKWGGVRPNPALCRFWLGSLLQNGALEDGPWRTQALKQHELIQ